MQPQCDYSEIRGRPIVNLSGMQFGRLTVESFYRLRNRKAYWTCRCICGRVGAYRSDGLKRGMHKSCGCGRAEASKARALQQNRDEFGFFLRQDGSRSVNLVKPFSLSRRVVLRYPYLGEGTAHTDDLVGFINTIVPHGLPDHIRADVCQEMLVDILSDNLRSQDAHGATKKYIREAYGPLWQFKDMHAVTDGRAFMDRVRSSATMI